MPYAPLNGIELYYELHGSGPPLLLAHGQGGNHLSWWQQVPHFSRHYTCITYDARAFGRSIDVDGRGRASFGADAIALLDHLGVEDVRVVAHSMGGRPATAIATRDPRMRCRCLVLAGTTGAVADQTVRDRRESAAEARGDRGLGAFSVMPGFEEREPQRHFLLRQISRMNPPRPRDFLGPPNPPPPQPGQPPRVPMYERLAAAGLPVLFIVGEHDMICPADLIELCHRLIPGSCYHVVAGSGHSAYWERPEEFNDVVLQFLLDNETQQRDPD
jgi:pimeloyl-ACP methyl ester carboxylesterase